METPQPDIRSLYWYECAYCHKEINYDETQTREFRRTGECPACKVANSIRAIPAGKPGAWCDILGIEPSYPKNTFK